MIIALAEPADHPALADLWYDSWMSIGIANETDLDRDGVRARFYRETAHWMLLAAKTGGEVAGLLALLPAEDRIDQIFVHPDRKGQGIGLALLAEARRQMPRRIVLTTHETNTRARAFYEREGFRLERREDDDVHRRVKCHYIWTSA
jgi:ribosomal protein S18 acetylase RimI-like enzyme